MAGVELRGFKVLNGLLDEARGNEAVVVGTNVLYLPITSLKPSPYQPRRQFNEESLKELSDSIRQHGIIQPLLVRKIDESYEIIAGERRWQAAAIAKLKEIPVLLREISDQQALAIALVENIQRENLNPIEEATGIQKLITDCGLKQREVAQIIGKSRETVTNYLRILNLEEEVKQLIYNRIIDLGHAKALLGLTPAQQIEIARNLASSNEKISVRHIENLVREVKKLTQPRALSEFMVENLSNWQKTLASKLQAQIKVKIIGNDKGKVTIVYDSLDKLNEFVKYISLLTGSSDLEN